MYSRRPKPPVLTSEVEITHLYETNPTARDEQNAHYNEQFAFNEQYCLQARQRLPIDRRLTLSINNLNNTLKVLPLTDTTNAARDILDITSALSTDPTENKLKLIGVVETVSYSIRVVSNPALDKKYLIDASNRLHSQAKIADKNHSKVWSRVGDALLLMSGGLLLAASITMIVGGALSAVGLPLIIASTALLSLGAVTLLATGIVYSVTSRKPSPLSSALTFFNTKIKTASEPVLSFKNPKQTATAYH